MQLAIVCIAMTTDAMSLDELPEGEQIYQKEQGHGN